MGVFHRVALAIAVIFIAYGFKSFRDYTAPQPIPDIDVNRFWGAGNPTKYKENTAIQPFKIEYSDDVIQKLLKRIFDYNFFQEPLEGTAFQYGFNTRELKKFISYWRDTYLPNWKQREAYLNQFPHFKTQIQG